jgi:signal recognition particle subunit SEC65
LEVNENENTTYQNLCDTAKADLRGKFIAMSACIKKIERSQINDVMIYLKLLEKQEQANPKTNRNREIIKIRGEINEIETKKTIQRINETTSWFFENINKIDRPLANLTKMGEKKPKVVESGMQKGR